MNAKVHRIAIALLVLLTALAMNLTSLHVLDAREIKEQPGNRRIVLEEYSRPRGPILVAGIPIARSVATQDDLRFQRTYSDGPLYVPATGYYSFIYGATGVERTENAVLSGDDDRLLVDRLVQLFADSAPRGGAVSLTLNPAAQRAAYNGLAGRTGSVVALDPRTGRILALASSPSFDPGLLTGRNAADILETMARLEAEPDQPLLNRPLVSTIPPGSTFKIITAAAALETGRIDASTALPGPRRLDLPLTDKDLRNWNDRSCGAGNRVTLAEAMAISCNTAFAWLGMEVGADALRTQARAFGFDRGVTVPLRAATSRFPDDPDAPQAALSAIGQFDVRATTLQMAMVMAAIANKGVLMSPYLIDEVLAPDLTVLDRTQPREQAIAVSPATARILTEVLVRVVDAGTGSNARIPGVLVAGKTGTAQTSPERPPHAWFVAFAPADNPQVAVAVALENGGGETEVSGNRLAAPIARDVISAVIGRP